MRVLIVILVFSFGVFQAQNIKTKRGEIILDGNVVAKVANQADDYTFSDLKGSEIFSFKFVDKSVLDSVRDTYLEVNRMYNREKIAEVDYSSPSVFAGDEKIAVNTAVNAYKIIDAKGINIQKLDNLFSGNVKRKLDTKTKDAYTLRKKLDAYQIEVNNVGEIFSKGKKIGYFSNLPLTYNPSEPISERTDFDIEVYNTRSQLIGRYITTTKQVRSTNNKVFTLYREVLNRHSIIKYPTYKGIVERLLLMNPEFLKGV